MSARRKQTALDPAAAAAAGNGAKAVAMSTGAVLQQWLIDLEEAQKRMFAGATRLIVRWQQQCQQGPWPGWQLAAAAAAVYRCVLQTSAHAI